MITHVVIYHDGLEYSMRSPRRHHHLIAWLFDAFQETIEGEQGFLDHRGKFLTREEAEVHARACGQLTKPLIGGVLTSEDLW
jgi:hypothetical protein